MHYTTKRRRILSCTEPFLMILESLESAHSGLSNDPKIVENGSVQLKIRRPKDHTFCKQLEVRFFFPNGTSFVPHCTL